jgi:hypothetical protein
MGGTPFHTAFLIRRAAGLASALAIALSACAASAQEPEAGVDDPVAAARDALRETDDYPWYDPEADQFKRIDVVESRERDANRKSRWEGGGRANMGGPNIGNPFSALLNVLVWMLVILLIVILVGAVLWAFLKMEGRRAASSTDEVDQEESLGEADRIENLPFKVARPQTDLLAEARRLYEAGRYGEAVVYLFSYQLVQLDRHQLIRLTKGKTNRQYLREVRPRPELRTMLERTMIAFEEVFFGRREIDRERFETCWNQLDAFHQQLQHSIA